MEQMLPRISAAHPEDNAMSKEPERSANAHRSAMQMTDTATPIERPGETLFQLSLKVLNSIKVSDQQDFTPAQRTLEELVLTIFKHHFGDKSREMTLIYNVLDDFGSGKMSKRAAYTAMNNIISGHPDLQSMLRSVLKHPHAKWAPGDFDLDTPVTPKPPLLISPTLEQRHELRSALPPCPDPVSSQHPRPQHPLSIPPAAEQRHELRSVLPSLSTRISSQRPRPQPLSIPPTLEQRNELRSLLTPFSTPVSSQPPQQPLSTPTAVEQRHELRSILPSLSTPVTSRLLSIPPALEPPALEPRHELRSRLPPLGTPGSSAQRTFSDHSMLNALPAYELNDSSSAFIEPSSYQSLDISPEFLYQTPPNTANALLPWNTEIPGGLGMPLVAAEPSSSSGRNLSQVSDKKRWFAGDGPFIHGLCGKAFETRSKVKRHHWGVKLDDPETTTGCWSKHGKPDASWDDHPSCKLLPPGEHPKKRDSLLPASVPAALLQDQGGHVVGRVPAMVTLPYHTSRLPSGSSAAPLASSSPPGADAAPSDGQFTHWRWPLENDDRVQSAGSKRELQARGSSMSPRASKRPRV